MPSARGYWILCLILLPVAVVSPFVLPWGQLADGWETAAAIRAAAQNPLHPSNPLLPLPGNTSPRFTPYVIFWGALLRLTGANLFLITALAGIGNFLLFVTGLARWITREFKKPKLALFALITMMTVWGEGYGQANAYQFRMLFGSLAFVGIFTYGLCFHALAGLRGFLDNRSLGHLVAYALLSIVAFLTHPITAAFLFVAAAAMLLADGNWKRIFGLQFIPLLAVGVALVWPYFNYATVLTKGSSESWFEAPMFAGQIRALGPALLGIPLVFWLARRREHLSVVFGFLLCSIVYFLSWSREILIGSRFLLYGTIFLHLAVALYLLEEWAHWWQNASWRRPSSLTKVLVVLLIFLPALRFRTAEVKNVFVRGVSLVLHRPHAESAYEHSAFLAQYLHDGDVVLAEDETGWPVPALTGAKLVSQQKGDPLINEEILRRRHDVADFFGKSLTVDARHDLLIRYHVRYILLEQSRHAAWDATLLEQLSSLAGPAAARGTLQIYACTLAEADPTLLAVHQGH